jgi:LemA protein
VPCLALEKLPGRRALKKHGPQPKKGAQFTRNICSSKASRACTGLRHGRCIGEIMSLYAIVLLAAMITLALYGIVIYNSLVSVKHNVSKAWANIDVLLKQRHDELPKLVEVCKQYRDFEQTTLQRVMEARSKVLGASQSQDVFALGKAETALRGSLANLFAVAEAYPELRSNEQFLNLQERISALESAIADRREFYNESVNINNVRIEQFPDLIVARAFDFHPKVLLEFRTSEKADVNLKALFATP